MLLCIKRKEGGEVGRDEGTLKSRQRECPMTIFPSITRITFCLISLRDGSYMHQSVKQIPSKTNRIHTSKLLSLSTEKVCSSMSAQRRVIPHSITQRSFINDIPIMVCTREDINKHPLSINVFTNDAYTISIQSVKTPLLKIQ